jgi:hypothetical protein
MLTDILDSEPYIIRIRVARGLLGPYYSIFAILLLLAD